ncbi:SHOCT domain-containing protein [Planococcus salinarum]|uniref:SHOCT domain-containing protein n=1 Tax=Planococcus salinarum TaxID=622695 RepID=UPI00163D571C|nr:SHOCT domain-containing protein [Planococcus salinarum]
MNAILIAGIPLPLGLLMGLGVLLVVVLTIYWFFMAKNNQGSQKVDALPPNNDAHRLQDRYDRGEISEEDYRRQLKELEHRPDHR